MKGIDKFFENLNKWLDKEVAKVTEESEQQAKKTVSPDRIAKNMSDWANIYDNTPISFEEMMEFDTDKKTGLLKAPTEANRCIK